MDSQQQDVARQCLAAAEANSLTFHEILGALAAVGIEGYLVDYRRATCAYYDADGDSIELTAHRSDIAVAAEFDPAGIQAAIREAQAQVPGYTYQGFCDEVKRAGCAGYLVSILGRRALYFGRTGETHVELFPGE